MTIRAGTRLGPYEVSARVGAGGMGEVWSARDTRLGRDVALKILPESFAADPDRLRRFEQEARAAGSLNHPNLISIFDVGSENGTPFLVMELLDGESLRDKLGDAGAGSAPRIPVRKALDYAGQIAQGLAVAHDLGIVHRDLKPDNLFVTKDGRVKILDFGLAKLTTRGDDTSEDDRTRERETSPGTVLGTVGYMSPEQVRGKPADHRSDIFSYGAILYEMLSGTRAFRGESAADTMSAILHQDPPELSGESAGVSPALDRIVHRCIEKSRDERFNSAHDLAYALEAISGNSTSGVRPAIEPGPRFRRRAVMGAIALLAIAAAFLAGRRQAGAPTAAAPAGHSPVLTQLTFTKGVESFPSLSPDGTAFVYTALTTLMNADIYFQRVGGETAINLTKDSPNGDVQAAFSPDGQQIAFRSGERESAGIYVMGATGEGRRRLTDFGFNPAWMPDGNAIVIATEGIYDPMGRSSISELWRVDVASGRKTRIKTDGDAVQPNVSPHGKRIAFWALPRGTGKRILYSIKASGGDRVALNDDDWFNWNPVWSADGRSLYFASTRGGPANIWRIPLDEESGKALGGMEAVTTSAAGIMHFSIARNGSFIFGSGTSTSTVERIPLDGTMKPTVVVSGSRAIWEGTPSPDGQWVVLKTFDTQEDLLVAKSDGSGLRRLTNDRYKDRGPTWSPDSQKVIFFSDRGGNYDVWRIDRDGGNLEQLTRLKDHAPANSLVSPDGKTMVSLFTNDARSAALIDLTKPIDQRVHQWLPQIDARTSFFARAWSPDGSRIAGNGQPDEAGVWIYNVGSRAYEKIADRGAFCGWLGPGSVAISPDGNLYAVDLATKKQRRIFGFADDVSSAITVPDGSAIFALRRSEERDIWMLRQEATGAAQN